MFVITPGDVHGIRASMFTNSGAAVQALGQ
jgi:hypothetical protein